MTSFLISHAIYAIVLFGVLEAACIPISSELRPRDMIHSLRAAADALGLLRS